MLDLAHVDVAHPEYWDRTARAAADLVAMHADAADAEGADPDLAWRGLMRDVLDAVADMHDGDRVAAAGAIHAAICGMSGA